MLSMSPVVSKHWLRRWEVALAVMLLVVCRWLPAGQYPVTLSDAALWFGSVVLGSGLLRDLWALWVTRAPAGEQEVAMCAESIVGAASVACGLALVTLVFVAPHWVPSVLGQTWRLEAPVVAGFLAAALIFSAWVHDLVFVKRDGRFRLERHRDHGSFVVHLFRGQASACAMPPKRS